jgi:hypothetical protein
MIVVIKSLETYGFAAVSLLLTSTARFNDVKWSVSASSASISESSATT